MNSGQQVKAERRRIAELLLDGRAIVGEEERRVPSKFNDKHVTYVHGRSQGMTISEAAGKAEVSMQVAYNLESSLAVDYARKQYRSELASNVQDTLHDRALANVDAILDAMQPKDYTRLYEKILRLSESNNQDNMPPTINTSPTLPPIDDAHDAPHAPTKDLQSTETQINSSASDLDTSHEPTKLPDFLDSLS